MSIVCVEEASVFWIVGVKVMLTSPFFSALCVLTGVLGPTLCFGNAGSK